LPPSGGDDDRIPPKVISVNPLPNTVNYSGNNIEIEFDEYVDRRSFRESLFISPKPKGELEFSWSGKSVEIIFSDNLEKNRTYVISIGTGLKDLRGGNAIQQPIVFAISTGSKIDNGKVSGTVYDFSTGDYPSDRFKNLIIGVYSKNRLINPEKDIPDFITQVNQDGLFTFNNLPEGEFRMFAINDNDRNFLFDKNIDDISVLAGDILIKDTLPVSNVDFLMSFTQSYFAQNLYSFISSDRVPLGGTQAPFQSFRNQLTKDSLGLLFTTLKNNEIDFPPELPSYFYFYSNNLPKLYITENIKYTDTNTKKNIPLSYKWVNDSLLQISAMKNVNPGSVIKVTVDFRGEGKQINSEFLISVPDSRKMSKIEVKNEYDSLDNMCVILNKNNINHFKAENIKGIRNYLFDNLPQSEYRIFSFEDINLNGIFDRGSYYPFIPSERFYFTGKPINTKGGWTGEVYIKLSAVLSNP
jgi:hypothetical protein